VPVLERAMREVDLLSILVFLYENRAQSAPVDQDMQEASEMLQREGRVTLHVDTCKPVKIDTSEGDIDVLIEAINLYQPQPPISFHVAKFADVESMSRLNVRGMSRYTYTSGFSRPMPFPALHGGEVVIESDVELGTIVDSINVSDVDAIMTSFVVVTGTILSCTEEALNKLLRSLQVRLQLSSDDRLFGMLLVGGSDHALKYTREDVVRSWSLSCTASEGKLNLQVKSVTR